MVIATPSWPSAIHMGTPTVCSQVGPTLYRGTEKEYGASPNVAVGQGRDMLQVARMADNKWTHFSRKIWK